ncbi:MULTISPECIES: DUF2185 domain-containing protein [Bacillus cereus group]|uniref:Immunity protein Imm33 domain-containing protein n=1 Tax=Bacillus mycoides TaxID=1405 RepID=A0A1E8BMI6_BACMY|nr:DUF2185 domain-containing protein [Bacillus mycoides]MBJ8072434.1 DUF2185 domain-containing protein [Bacillus cereus]MBJ8189251.1 DUF2185 domain-containing protein [Bacillus cereus]OFD92506.1 hypothetical protein BWGOE11_32500 [Bacillus mycoides]OFD99671.1 hypothetical protein BWGOE13_32180 [Bacillus mycoides]
MTNRNDAYGGFIVSRNVFNGVPIRYSFREESSISQLNGWNIFSEVDDDEYVNNPKNFCIINAESMYSIVPQMLEIFEAPYGTDLFWVYEDSVHVGFYDLVQDCMTDINKILNVISK